MAEDILAGGFEESPPQNDGKVDNQIIQAESLPESDNYAPSLLKSETEEAEELFSDLKVSEYVLDISNINKKNL